MTHHLDRPGDPPRKYACLHCGYTYNPDRGDPDHGLPPGTPLEDAPADWRCPKCGASQDDFAAKDEA